MSRISAVADFPTAVEVSSANGVSNVPGGPRCSGVPAICWIFYCCCLPAVVVFPAVAGVHSVVSDPVVAVALLLL